MVKCPLSANRSSCDGEGGARVVVGGNHPSQRPIHSPAEPSTDRYNLPVVAGHVDRTVEEDAFIQPRVHVERQGHTHTHASNRPIVDPSATTAVGESAPDEPDAASNSPAAAGAAGAASNTSSDLEIPPQLSAPLPQQSQKTVREPQPATLPGSFDGACHDSEEKDGEDSYNSAAERLWGSLTMTTVSPTSLPPSGTGHRPWNFVDAHDWGFYFRTQVLGESDDGRGGFRRGRSSGVGRNGSGGGSGFRGRARHHGCPFTSSRGQAGDGRRVHRYPSRGHRVLRGGSR